MIEKLNDVVDVAKILNISIQELDRILIDLKYTEFEIPKKKGGTRKISAPNEQLKLIQQKINILFNSFLEDFQNECVFGFSKKRNSDQFTSPIVSNAVKHVNKKNILSLDISNFFETITAKMVYELFKNKPFDFSDKVALIFTRLTTYMGVLPTGSPTSPILSNFVFHKLDHQIQEIGNKKNIIYTRYADDITLSSNNNIDLKVVDELNNVLSPFQLNSKKTRLIKSNRQQKVTGIVVNQKLNVDRKWIKKTRAMLHDLTTNGLSIAAERHFKKEGKEQEFINKLFGNLSFIGQVRGKDDSIYKTYRDLLYSNKIEHK